jgi:transposase
MDPADPTPVPPPSGPAALPSPEQLPDDPETLKRMVLELLATLQEERRDKDALRHRLDLLLRRLYGPRTERFEPNQPSLFDPPATDPEPPSAFAAVPPVMVEAGPPPPPRRRCRPRGRRPLPEGLPRRVVEHCLTDAERVCVCGCLRVDIGVEPSEQLDWQPASLFVWHHRVHKYACPRCAAKATHSESATAETGASTTPKVAQAEAASGPAVVAAVKPAMPIPKGLPGAGLLAYLTVSKYTDHLPLYRQESIVARQGVFLPRSTTGDWLASCAELLRPLYDRMVSRVLQSRCLHTDDTTVKNQRPPPGATDLARLWGYLGDENHPYNVFDFTTSRRRDGPEQFLADYQGYSHADAFSGYDRLYLPRAGRGVASIVEVACNAHARRKFHEARTSDAVRSHRALAWYGQLYELERRARDWDEAARHAMRQALALPIPEQLRAWLEAERPQVLPRSPMAGAIGYALNNWSALIRYTEAGFLSIDNNVAEREMKRIAVGRKNWLFVGSAKGGRTAAVLSSFTSTCQRLNVEPGSYLQEVLSRLPTTTSDEQREALLPDRWQSARTTRATPPSTPSLS